MPGQIAAPIPVTPPHLFASLNATLSSAESKRVTPIRSIQERDWDVPAPPPPSPVSFHPDHWQRTLRH
ncbi:hypothetical protein F4813DRAFT_389761 [Daldinia decipiens]|uniref:uncharacterized protein n=1 Tax=Daldinia decipiens TaxID=326647 RepID=UPI0020C20369|nr:uncharacterized protein F4813DRAFT_389761 [Daldinia decipiens]KAI1657178.1 hypothetical protein F4813DRAFT_389761 [Daldinia decipiens]